MARQTLLGNLRGFFPTLSNLIIEKITLLNSEIFELLPFPLFISPITEIWVLRDNVGPKSSKKLSENCQSHETVRKQ